MILALKPKKIADVLCIYFARFIVLFDLIVNAQIFKIIPASTQTAQKTLSIICKQYTNSHILLHVFLLCIYVHFSVRVLFTLMC